MNDETKLRLDELLGPELLCHFLSVEELDALAEDRLAADRRRAFEDHARSCPACREMARDLTSFVALTSRGGGVTSERRAFRAAEGGVRRRLGLPATRRSRRALTYGLLAASAAAAVLLVFLIAPLTTPSPLFEEVTSIPFLPPPAVRGGADPEIWERARRAWEDGDMVGVVRTLTPALEQAPDDPNLLFYLGVAHLRLDEHEAAVAELQRLDRLQADIPSEHTRWFLAIALDGAGRVEDACTTLRSVAGLGGSRAGDARQIAERACL